jgi:hypothetical protein
MTERAKVVDVADEDMEIVEFDDTTTERVYVCQHPNQRGREVGIGDSAGEVCKLYTVGIKRTIDADLERRLSWRDSKPDNCDND